MKQIPLISNAIRAQLDEEPEYVEDYSDRRYMILYPEDYQGYGKDVDGNIALLLNKENAEEVKRLAEDIIEDIEE